MSSLVVEVHPHGQHDVVGPVVLRLGGHKRDEIDSIIFCHRLYPHLRHQNYYTHDNHPHDLDNLPDFLPFQQIASSGLLSKPATEMNMIMIAEDG